MGHVLRCEPIFGAGPKATEVPLKQQGARLCVQPIEQVFVYQTSFKPSWIWREEVDVDPMIPAFPMRAPFASKAELFASFKKLGAAKFG